MFLLLLWLPSFFALPSLLLNLYKYCRLCFIYFPTQAAGNIDMAYTKQWLPFTKGPQCIIFLQHWAWPYTSIFLVFPLKHIIWRWHLCTILSKHFAQCFVLALHFEILLWHTDNHLHLPVALFVYWNRICLTYCTNWNNIQICYSIFNS